MILISLSVYTYYQHTLIDSQAATIELQTDEINKLNRDIKAREVVAVKRKAAQLKIEKEVKTLKDLLSESLKDNVCNDVPIPSDTDRMLKELYSSGPK